VPLPDLLIRAGIQRCSRTATRLAGGNSWSDTAIAREVMVRAMVENTAEANARHFEVPAAFFACVR
jgi:cyclopropane-fatty-acyl-phospholipid synthase